MSENDRTLHFSRTEVLSLVGIAFFVVSLLLPAARMGSGPTEGITWFAMGTITALMPSRDEATILSLVALIMNASMLVTIICVFNRLTVSSLSLVASVLGLICALILLLRPYSGFVEIYFGYYLWIVSAIWTFLVPRLSQSTCIVTTAAE